MGVDIVVHPKHKPVPGTPEWNILGDEIRAIFAKPYEERRVGMIVANPFEMDELKTEIRIANTMCEADHIAPVWARKLNTMDYIIVPNKWNKMVFRDCDVRRPIEIIPPGIDTERFPYYERPEREYFTFGIVGYLDQFDRKGAFDVIRAFASEFEPNEKVRLILKSSDPSFGYYSRFTDPRIRTITENVSFEELNELYRKLDCFVFPSKAEGIGLPPREAMSTGLPTIITNWSGLTDIAHGAYYEPKNRMDTYSISFPITPIRYEKRPNFIEQDGNWAIMDIKRLMFWMRYVYENRSISRRVGKAGSDYIKQRFDWKIVAQKLKVYLEKICTAQ